MKCSEASVALSKQYDGGQLSLSEKKHLDEHLAVCLPCRNFKSQLQEITQELNSESEISKSSANQDQLPQSTKDKLSQKLDKK